MLSATALLTDPWSWAVAAGAPIAALVGLAYWWVVPIAPPGSDPGSTQEVEGVLDSALALLASARRWTLAGIIVAAAVGLVGAVVSGVGGGTKSVLLAAAIVAAALVAFLWARSSYVWPEHRDAGSMRRAAILHNGRFLLSHRRRVLVGRRELEIEARVLDGEVTSVIDRALRARPVARRRRLLKVAAAAHARHSRLIGIDDFPSLAQQDLDDAIAFFGGAEAIQARWMVPVAWLLIVTTSVGNLMWLDRVRRSAVTDRLREWRDEPLAAYDLGFAPLDAMEAVAAGGDSPAAKAREIERLLESWVSTRRRD